MESIISKEKVDQALIDKWKREYSGVYVYASEDGKKAYFRTPTRQEINAAGSVANKPMESNTILAKATFLAGDMEVITEDKYFYGLQEHLKGIIKKVSGELTEL
jgi:hypothetical protein